MLNKKTALWATTALVALLSAGAAAAQSTASQRIEEATSVEEVVVTGARGPRAIEGVVVAETAPKARTSITQEYLATQPAGQTIFQSLNQTPGLNFTNNDPYGASGGNIRLRGQDGNRVALLWDGIPLNDTGNYATFTNQLLDPEIVSQVNVNTGTSDVDAPSPAAVGGTVNFTTLRPENEFGGWVQPSVGSFDFRRVIARVDSGEVGPFGTAGFVSGSYQQYDKFRGPGELERKQGNAYLFQEFRDSDFVGVGFHYNENRNNQYRALNLAQFDQSGGSLDNDYTCTRVTPVNGTAQNESTQNTVVSSQRVTVNNTSCTNYYELRNNPSNTGNIRGQSSFALGEQFTLTFDPYFQYTLANGGGFTVVSEREDRLDLNTTNNANITNAAGCAAVSASGVDLNGDGDGCDNVTLYTPNNTNTRRYGFTTSLLYSLTDEHQFRVAYTVDYGRHRQTAENGFVTANGGPEDVFAGKDGYGRRVRGTDGSFLRGRDRFSIASLQQIAAQYRGNLLDDRLILDIGVRAPFFTRDLNQYCYTADAIAGPLVGGFNPYCTTQTPIAQANGAVRFGTSTTDYIRPFATTFEYDAVLPNVGASYEIADGHRIFASFAEGFAAPRTDNLYSAALNTTTGQTVFLDVEPETSTNYDLGYRYSAPGVVVYATIFHNKFENRIQSSFDPDLGFSVDRNVGAVEFTGFDGQIGFDPTEQITVSAFLSYLNAELKDDLVGTTAGSLILTAGKKLVEVPEWTTGGRVEVRPVEGLDLGLQVKFVDSRFTNDLNTEQVEEYILWDFDARYDLGRFGFEDTFIQLNVSNLFNEKYIGSINSQGGSGLATGQVGAPLTVQASLRFGF